MSSTDRTTVRTSVRIEAVPEKENIMSNIKKTTTLAELAGTNRGLSTLTVAQIKALLKGEAPAKVAKPKSEFYEKVIVGGRDQRALRQKVNTEAAAWMREKGLVPSGQAWVEVKNGER